MTLLDYIKSIIEKKPIEIDNNYSQYGLNIYFSKFKNCLFIINELTKINISDAAHYKYLMKSIPMGWQRKIDLNKKNQEDPDLILISDFYNISLKESKTYKELMTSNELNKIREYYNV